MNIAASLLEMFWSGNAPLAQAGSVAAVVFLAWGGWMAGVAVFHVRKRKNMRQRFREVAIARGLTDAESATLWLLGRHTSTSRRQDILESYDEFRQCIEQARTAAGNDLSAWPEMLHEANIASLRRKMMAPQWSRFSLTRSTDMERNQVCEVRPEKGKPFETFVTRVTSQELQLAMPEDTALWDALRPGARITISFWRTRDARYEFTAPIMEVALGLIFVAHTDLARNQQRRHVRIRSNTSIRIAAMDARKADAEKPHIHCDDVTLQDISAGGAAFVSEGEHPPGEWIVLQVEMTPEMGKIRLPARVVRQIQLHGTSKLRRRVAVQFKINSTHIQNDLTHLMASLQQHRIQRFRSRMNQFFRPRTHAATTAKEAKSGAPEKTAAAQSGTSTPASAN